MPTILVVDDDAHIREVITFALAKAGFRTIEAADGQQALERFAREAPDLVVLDIVMPELDGTEVCRRLRRGSHVPIVFLSSKDEEIDRILGLELGGDDYLAKPFSPRELVARVRAVLRRTAGEPGARTDGPRVLRHGRLTLDLDQFKAFWEGREVVLTMTELGILRTLIERPGKVFSRDHLMGSAYESLTAEGRWQPRAATLDLALDSVRPRPPAAPESAAPADPAGVAAGRELMAVMQDAQAITLAGIRVTDFRGVVVASTGEEFGRSLAEREEVARALRGEPVSLLRERVSEAPRPPLASLSRGTRVRVFVALPVLDGRRVVGAVVLSRSPRSIGETLYDKRLHLLAGAGVLLAVVVLMTLFTSRTISRPLEAVVGQSERAARGEQGAVAPLARPITREVARLSEAVAAMARTLEERADYIRTFASQVSHEFKAPLTAIRGAVELLRDHAATMSEEERDRFLENLAADAQRLERLVRRLLELARADVAEPGDERADLAAVLAAIAERHRRLGIDVRLALAPRLGTVAMGEETLDTILSNLLENARQHGGPDIGVTIRAARDGVRASVRVEDDGPGCRRATRRAS